jgi:hypothetical protein
VATYSRPVESFFFDVLHFLYFLSLGVLIGGALALGGAAAPTLFRELDRARAGTVFGAILERWDGVAVFAAMLLAAASALKFVNFETGESKIYLRYVAVAFVIVATLYSSAWANPIARALRRQTPRFDELPAEAQPRREFAGYHRRSVRAMTLVLLVGLVALYLS